MKLSGVQKPERQWKSYPQPSNLHADVTSEIATLSHMIPKFQEGVQEKYKEYTHMELILIKNGGSRVHQSWTPLQRGPRMEGPEGGGLRVMTERVPSS